MRKNESKMRGSSAAWGHKGEGSGSVPWRVFVASAWVLLSPDCCLSLIQLLYCSLLSRASTSFLLSNPVGSWPSPLAVCQGLPPQLYDIIVTWLSLPWRLCCALFCVWRTLLTPSLAGNDVSLSVTWTCNSFIAINGGFVGPQKDLQQHKETRWKTQKAQNWYNTKADPELCWLVPTSCWAVTGDLCGGFGGIPC